MSDYYVTFTDKKLAKAYRENPLAAEFADLNRVITENGASLVPVALSRKETHRATFNVVSDKGQRLNNVQAGKVVDALLSKDALGGIIDGGFKRAQPARPQIWN